MKPVEFPEQNCTYAKDQQEYLPLPSHRTGGGEVISCWGLSFRERLRLLWSGRLWVRQLTFHDPLQPLLPQIERPFERASK